MKNIKVSLLAYSELEPILVALTKPYQNKNADFALLEKIIKVHKHESVAEHIVMHFEITGVSRLELQEHMRHRIASPTVQSTRYTIDKINFDFEKFFVTPNEEQLSKLDEDVREFYLSYLESMQKNSIEFLKWCKNLKIPNDMAKYGILESLRTNFSWTINLRALINFLALRESPKAHFEIKEVARLIRESLKDTYIDKLI